MDGTIEYILTENVEVHIAELQKLNFQIYVCEDSSSIENFFLRTQSNLPQDPLLTGKVNYDAFVDSIWGGLDRESYSRVALILKQVDKLKRCDHIGFCNLVCCFEEIGFSLVSEEYGINKEVFLKVLLCGKWNYSGEGCL